jgi:hypothetical protein
MIREKGNMGLLRISGGYGRAVLFLLFCLFLMTGLVLPDPVKAEEGWGPGQDTWKFELGGYFPSTSTSLSVSGLESGTDLDLENTLGFDDSDTIFRLDGYWRFFERHRLGFGFYQFNREGSATLTEDIEIGDVIFGEGSQVSSELNLGFYTIDYMYSFYQGEKWEMSAGLGVYWVDVELAASGYVIVDDVPVLDASEATNFSGPLPFLGLSFEYYITPKWLAIAKGGYFQLSVNDIDGSLTNLGAKLEYQFTRYFGLGIGYDYFRIDVEGDDGEKRADILYEYQGVQAYGILKF